MGIWIVLDDRRTVCDVNKPVRFDFFPPNFPPELAYEAFVPHNEAAWTPPLAVIAVNWLGVNGYAVLGTELWVVNGARRNAMPFGVTGGPEIHGNTVGRQSRESWSAFVVRSRVETLDYLRSFSPADIVSQGELYFNVTWVSEEEYEELGRPVM